MLMVILLVCFALFSKSVKQGFMKQADFAVTVKMQDKVSRLGNPTRIARFDEIMEEAGFFASPMVSSVAVVVITGIAFIRVKSWKKKIAVLMIPVAFALIVFGELYGKSVVHHPAPPFFMIKNPTTIFPTYYINEEYSYPSGHAARATFIAVVIWVVLSPRPGLEREKRKKILVGVSLVGYAGLISFSRIYLGHHWASDILGGVLLGGALALPSIL